MKKFNIYLIIMLSLMGYSLLSAAAENAVAVTVNGKAIKQTTLDFIIKDASDKGQKVDENEKGAIINRLISNELIYQEAVRSGVDKRNDIQIREELAKRELVVNAYLQDFMKNNPISDAEIKSEYQKFKNELGNKEYKVSHILLDSESEAVQIIGQINKGADFTKLATEKSRDPSVKDNKGDLGWFSLGNILKPFNLVLPYLSKGAISKEPIQSRYGWHIIKLEDSRDIVPPEYDKVKDSLQKQISKRQLEKMLTELRAKATIVDNTNLKK